MSNYLEQKLLDVIFRGASWSVLTNVYVSLHTTTDPGEDGLTGEISTAGTGYGRKAVPVPAGWNAAVSEVGGGFLTDNASAIVFATPTTSWGTVAGFALWDAATAGNCLLYGPLQASKVINSGDTVQFDVGQLDVIFK